jgi:hypothetical protein
MAKKGVFFQLYLNPDNKEDQQIITWLKAIPRSRRSQKVREILLWAIRGQSQRPPEATIPESPLEASGMARSFLGSLSKRPASRG